MFLIINSELNRIKETDNKHNNSDEDDNNAKF